MRLRGTGNTPPGNDQLPEGLVFDADPVSGEALIEKGWAEEVPPEEDLGRTRLQMAHAAVRGEQPTHPDDLAAGDEWYGIGENPLKGKDPIPAVTGQDPDAEAVEVDNTEAGAPPEAGQESAVATSATESQQSPTPTAEKSSTPTPSKSQSAAAQKS